MNITDESYDGQDDIWTHWFSCPKCDDSLIMIGTSYCPSCGKKINWKLEEDYKS